MFEEIFASYPPAGRLYPDKVDLLGTASNQRGISRCAIGGEARRFCFCYEGWGFCVSEILGQGCQVQRPKTLERYLSGSPAISQQGSSVLTVSAIYSLFPMPQKKEDLISIYSHGMHDFKRSSSSQDVILEQRLVGELDDLTVSVRLSTVQDN